MKIYKDRQEAGILLAQHLLHYKQDENALILCLPRGGVPVGYEVAKRLHLPLDVYIVRKLGVPGHEELALGALAPDSVIVWNEDLLRQLAINETQLQFIIEKEQTEMQRRNQVYRAGKPSLKLQGKTIILIDDGIATGATMKAAITAVSTHQPKKIVCAVPVAAAATAKEFHPLLDEFICPLLPKHFSAVGLWYETFPQTTDQEVQEILNQFAS